MPSGREKDLAYLVWQLGVEYIVGNLDVCRPKPRGHDLYNLPLDTQWLAGHHGNLVDDL